MDRGRTAWRTAAFVDPEEILLRRHLGDRPDLSNDGPAGRRLALRAQDEEPDFAVGFGDQGCRARGGLRLLLPGEGLDAPEQRTGRQRRHLLLGERLDDETALLRLGH